MARQRISDLWGGTPANIPPIVVSIVAAVPLALIAIAVADNRHVPECLRWVISPGFQIGLRAMSDVSGRKALDRSLLVAFTFNFSYYLTLIFGLLMLRSFLKHN